MSSSKPEMLLWLSDARGRYIPRDFANSFADRAKHVYGIATADWKILEDGPDQELYWEIWDDVCRNAVVTDENGIRYRVHQDGDCWLVPEGMEWSEEQDGFVWPEEEPAKD